MYTGDVFQKCWEHLFVDLPFFQLVDPVPQQSTFVCHSPERSGGKKQKDTFQPIVAALKQTYTNAHSLRVQVMNAVPQRGEGGPAWHKLRHLLPPVIEETRFVGLNNHNIKQVSPVLPYDVVHSSIPEDKDRDISLCVTSWECWKK